VADLGFVGFGQQSGPLGLNDDLLALPRFPFGGVYGDLDDFATKVASLPLPLLNVTVKSDTESAILADTLLPAHVKIPELHIKLISPRMAQQVQCFASGQGAIPTTVNGDTVTAKAPKPLPIGRSRYNCTAPSGENGRYYWFSYFFIKKQANGDWYPEP